jgi:hypothetical protein
MGITWSGGADFGGSLTAGVPYSIDSLVLPPGQSPSNMSLLLFSVGVTLDPKSPGPSSLGGGAWLTPAVMSLYFVDSLGVEHTPRNSSSSASGWNSSISSGANYAFALNEGQCFEEMGWHPTELINFNAGGLFRLKGVLPSGWSTKTLNGSIVAMMFDFAWGPTGPPPPPSSGDSWYQDNDTFASPSFVYPSQTRSAGPLRTGYPLAPGYYGASQFIYITICGIVEIATTPTIPLVSSSPNYWTNIVGRTNGAIFLSLAVYSGPIVQGASLTWSYANAPRHLYAFYGMWDCQVGKSILKLRPFAQIIG